MHNISIVLFAAVLVGTTVRTVSAYDEQEDANEAYLADLPDPIEQSQGWSSYANLLHQEVEHEQHQELTTAQMEGDNKDAQMEGDNKDEQEDGKTVSPISIITNNTVTSTTAAAATATAAATVAPYNIEGNGNTEPAHTTDSDDHQDHEDQDHGQNELSLGLHTNLRPKRTLTAKQIALLKSRIMGYNPHMRL